VPQLLADQVDSFYDDRLPFSALVRSIRAARSGPDTLAVPSDVGWEVLERSRRGARLRPDMQALRAELRALLGDAQTARQEVTAVVSRHGSKDPFLYLSYAQVMFRAGSYDDATRQSVRRAADSTAEAYVAWALVATLQRLDGARPSAAAACAYADARSRFGAPPPTVHVPAGSARCSSA
jgi:hypothetical protein